MVEHPKPAGAAWFLLLLVTAVACDDGQLVRGHDIGGARVDRGPSSPPDTSIYPDGDGGSVPADAHLALTPDAKPGKLDGKPGKVDAKPLQPDLPPVKVDSGTPGTWTLGQRPFAASSSWNTPVKSGATYSKLGWPSSTGYNYGVNWDAYSPAVYFSKASDPLVQVAIPDNWGWPAGNIPVHLPAGVTGAAGTDGEILIIDGTTVHNFWQFNRTGLSSASAQAYGRADVVKDSGWGSKSPFKSAGIVATGSSQLAGLLVQAESDAGEIEHALQMALDYAITKPGYTGEAISGDGSNASGIAQEGQRLAIQPGTAMPSGLSTLGQKVFRTLQKYGVFVIDVAGGCSVLRAQQNAYSSTTIDALWQDMQKLTPLLQAVN